MRRRKLVAAVAAAGVAVIAVASSGIATADVPRQAPGITDDEITVAGLGPDNPYRQFGADTGARARFEKENEAGGVNGRQINYLGWNDDGNTNDTNSDETQRLIQQEQVAALVPVITPWFIKGADFAQQSKIPSFGWGIAPGFCETEFAFGFTGCLVPDPVKLAGKTWGVLLDDLYKAEGDSGGAEGKTAAVIAEDNDSGNSGVITISASAESVGMNVVYKEATMPAAEGGTPVSDFSPFVNDIMTSNDGGPPDVVFEVISQNNLLGFQPALEQAGFEGIITNAVLYAPQAAALMDGKYAFTQFATPEAAGDTPAVQEFVDAVAAVDPEAEINQPTIAAYVAADMFIQALKKAGKNPTPQSIQKAASELTYSQKDFVGPTKYPRSFSIGPPCGQLATSDGTDWSVSVPYQCDTLVNVKSGKTVKY